MPGLKPYRPSNGTEGMIFQEKFCDNCIHDKEWREKDKNPCQILSNTLMYERRDAEYPKEWVHDRAGKGTCTAFEKEVT